MKLSGKVAIVTGSSRGIGKHIALKLAENGADVVITFNSNREKALEVVKNIKDMGRSAIGLELNILDRNKVHNFVDVAIKEFGKIDILVNNAGVLQQKPFDTITDEDWDVVLDTNLKGTFICCQKIIPHMQKNKFGRIVNISSIGGQWGGNLAVHYAASKAGIISLTRSLAKIYSKDGINTNCISPGLVLTEMIEGELSTDEGKQKLKSIPMGRAAKPEEIGDIALALVSEAGDYITGQTINANGGMFFST